MLAELEIDPDTCSRCLKVEKSDFGRMEKKIFESYLIEENVSIKKRHLRRKNI